jgi:small ligand-binding sensory domain FIST
VRICSEIREELEPETEPLAAGLGAMESGAQRIAGAVYVSCAGRGGPHFGAPSAELQIVRRALGDVPLVGFFAGGEIARHHLYGYTGVLTVFCAD